MDEQRGGQADATARAFAIVWALAMLFRFDADTSVSSATSVIVLLATSAVFVTRGAPLAWLALIAAQLVDLWRVLPLVQASDFFAGTMHVFLLAAWFAALIRRRSWRITRAELFTEARPLLAAGVVLLFFFAVFHKVNADFFDPAVSWAPWFYDYFAGLLPVQLPFIRGATPYLVAAVEVFPVVALLIVRARGAGILVIWALFLLVAIEGIIQFSALTYAGTILFIDAAVLSAALDRVDPYSGPGGARALRKPVLAAWIVLATCALIGIPFIVWVVVWLLAFVSMAVLLLRQKRKLGVTLAHSRLGWPPWYFWPLIVLVVLNELSAYSGVKDWPTFRMYSNLEVDSCGSNHLLFSGSVPGRTDEIVTTPETWSVLGGYFRRADQRWEMVAGWLVLGTDKHETSAWDAATFAELVASLARRHGMDPSEVKLVYLRAGVRVEESLADLLRSSRRHPFQRFFARRPEPNVPCAERGSAFPPTF